MVQEVESVFFLVRVVDINGLKMNVSIFIVNDFILGDRKVVGSKKSFVEEIFDVYKVKLKYFRVKFDVKCCVLIEKVLCDYFDFDIIQVFDGCSKIFYNMGDNDRGEVYDGLYIILCDLEQIEWFMRNLENLFKLRSRDKVQEKRDRNDDI